MFQLITWSEHTFFRASPRVLEKGVIWWTNARSFSPAFAGMVRVTWGWQMLLWRPSAEPQKYRGVTVCPSELFSSSCFPISRCAMYCWFHSTLRSSFLKELFLAMKNLLYIVLPHLCMFSWYLSINVVECRNSCLAHFLLFPLLRRGDLHRQCSRTSTWWRSQIST